MIKNFNGTDILPVFNEAMRLAGFDAIKDGFLVNLDSLGLPALQAAGVRLAAEKLRTWPGSDPMVLDGPLLGILQITWPDVGLSDDDVSPLDPAQREVIFAGVMAVCKGIINDEATRLTTLAGTDTTLPVGWAGAVVES